MAYLSTVSMNKESWLKVRRTGIGGTDVAAILGLSPYKTAVDVYLEKIGQSKPVQENARMKAGRLLEDVVAQWWALENGCKVRRDNKVRFHSQYPVLLANIDRLISATNDDRGAGVLEVKTTSGFNFKRWEDNGLPPDTYCQIMHYLHVTGHKWGRVAVLVDGYDLKDIPVVYDAEYIALMREQLLDFWHNHVEKRVPPEPSNESDIRTLWPRVNPEKCVQVDDTTFETLERLTDVTRQLAELGSQKSDLEQQIKLLMKDASVLKDGDDALVTWRQSKDSVRFDNQRFKQDFPSLYNAYTESRPGSRRFVLKRG